MARSAGRSAKPAKLAPGVSGEQRVEARGRCEQFSQQAPCPLGLPRVGGDDPGVEQEDRVAGAETGRLV